MKIKLFFITLILSAVSFSASSFGSETKDSKMIPESFVYITWSGDIGSGRINIKTNYAIVRAGGFIRGEWLTTQIETTTTPYVSTVHFIADKSGWIGEGSPSSIDGFIDLSDGSRQVLKIYIR